MMSLVNRYSRRFNINSSYFNPKTSYFSPNSFINLNKRFSSSSTDKPDKFKALTFNRATSDTSNFKLSPTSGKSEPTEPLRRLHSDAIEQRRAKDNAAPTNVQSGGILSGIYNMFSGLFSSSAKATPQPTDDDLNKEERYTQFEDKHLPDLARRYKNNEFFFRDVDAGVAHQTPLAAEHRGKSAEEIEKVHELPKQISPEEAHQHAHGGETHPHMISLFKSVPAGSHYGGKDKLTQVINRQGLTTAEGDKALSEEMVRHIIPRSNVEGVLTPDQTRKLRELVRNPKNQEAYEAMKKKMGINS